MFWKKTTCSGWFDGRGDFPLLVGDDDIQLAIPVEIRHLDIMRLFELKPGVAANHMHLPGICAGVAAGPGILVPPDFLATVLRDHDVQISVAVHVNQLHVIGKSAVSINRMFRPCWVLIPVETCVRRTGSAIQRPFSGTDDIYLPIAVNVSDAYSPLIERRVVVDDDVLKRNVCKRALTRGTRSGPCHSPGQDNSSQKHRVDRVSHSAASDPVTLLCPYLSTIFLNALQ